MRWSPHVTVATVIEHQGRFLFVEERTKDGEVVFNQPAGHVENGETLEQAAIRETLEETGWDVSLEHVIGIYVLPSPKDPEVTYYRICFAGRAVRHHPDRALDDGILQAAWLTPEELVASNRARSALVPLCVADYRAGKRFPLDMIYEHRP